MNQESNAPVGTPFIPRFFHQLGILVLDGSGSMEEKATSGASKGKEVSAAVVELFNRLNVSRVKQNFSFAGIKFDTNVEISMQVSVFDYNAFVKIDLDPTIGKGGGTRIDEGLKIAKELADDFLQSAPEGGVPHKVLILLMSDGMCFRPDLTKALAQSLKANPKIQIASAYFGTVGDIDPDAQGLLKEVASDPVTFYTTVYDGEALRNFFERSISQSAGIKIE
jgi:hypothetical protein